MTEQDMNKTDDTLENPYASPDGFIRSQEPSRTKIRWRKRLILGILLPSPIASTLYFIIANIVELYKPSGSGNLILSGSICLCVGGILPAILYSLYMEFFIRRFNNQGIQLAGGFLFGFIFGILLTFSILFVENGRVDNPIQLFMIFSFFLSLPTLITASILWRVKDISLDKESEIDQG